MKYIKFIMTCIFTFLGRNCHFNGMLIRGNGKVRIGDGVIILGGVTIGKGVIIQTGAVVVKSIEKFAIAGGNPANVFKYRDIDSYERLKAMDNYAN